MDPAVDTASRVSDPRRRTVPGERLEASDERGWPADEDGAVALDPGVRLEAAALAFPHPDVKAGRLSATPQERVDRERLDETGRVAKQGRGKGGGGPADPLGVRRVRCPARDRSGQDPLDRPQGKQKQEKPDPEEQRRHLDPKAALSRGKLPDDPKDGSGAGRPSRYAQSGSLRRAQAPAAPVIAHRRCSSPTRTARRKV
jgi:hypothetical protein